MGYSIEYSSQIKNRTGIVTTAGTILNINDNRRGLIIQNLGKDPLFVKLGENASTSDFDFILKAGSATDDGLGGIMSYDVLSYTGAISVDGTTVRCTSTEI